MKINNSTAFVTGTNRGLGRQLVSHLLQAGAAKVYAGARNIGAIDVPWAADPRVRLIRIDVTDSASVDEAAAQAGDTTLLINNAGTLRFGSALDGDLAAYQADLDINLFGTVRVTRAFAPHLIKNSPGAVVNLSSIIALAPARGLAGYSIAKAAVHSYSQALRTELRASGVEVTAVYPAQIDTDMLKDVEAAKTAPEVVAERIVRELQAGAQEIYPDDSSAYLGGVYAAEPWRLEDIFAGAAG
ncbi:MAG TPA: SDR family NAD(P)-dependent oxidoreductase [Streptosporangiaceae bacterium]|nr:SDR family NAD(P)-dependent oxidoreductase [Streptosporangiaceae bacterium]